MSQGSASPLPIASRVTHNLLLSPNRRVLFAASACQIHQRRINMSVSIQKCATTEHTHIGYR